MNLFTNNFYSICAKTALCFSIFFIGNKALAQAPEEKKTYTDAELYDLSMDKLVTMDIVSASKINLENESETAGVVTVVTSEQIVNSGAKNMEEVLRSVPGFDVIRTGIDPSTNLGVRGLYSTDGTNNKILFMIDDHPVRSVFYGDATVFIGNYPIENIKQIEIIRGPGSTLFGAGAFLGVINIRTNQPDKNADVSVSAGSFGRYNLNAQVTRDFGEDFNVTVLANHLTTDGPSRQLLSDWGIEFSEPFAKTFGYNESPSMAPGLLNYGRATTQLNLNLDYKDFYLRGNYMRSDDEVPVGPSESLVRNSEGHNLAQYLEAGYGGKTQNEMGELLVKAYADRYEYHFDSDLWSEEAGKWYDVWVDSVFYSESDDQPLSFEGDAPRYKRGASGLVLGGEVNFAYNFNNFVNLLAGAMYEHYNLTNISTSANVNFFVSGSETDNMTFDGHTSYTLESLGGMRDINEDYAWITENDRHVYAGFGQADFNLKNIFKASSMDHFKLVAGVRYDAYNDAGGSLNPRAALLVAPNRNFYFKGLFGQAFRAPSFVELYFQNNSFLSGNKKLKPENVTTVEGVAGYRIDESFDVNITYFNTKVTDNIQPVPNANFNYVYTNAGNVRTSGVEAGLRYAFSQGAYVTGSFTIQEVLDVSRNEFSSYDFLEDKEYRSKQDDYNPGRAPAFTLNLGGNYPVTKNININTSFNHLGERKRTQAKAFYIGDDYRPTGEIVASDDRAPIPARTIWNTSITLSNFDFASGLSLQMTGYNLLDANNYNPLRVIRGDDLLRAGRHWGIRMKYSF